VSRGGDSERGAKPVSGAIPFWVHQLVEMLLGGLLLLEGARTGQHTAVLFGMGAGLLLLSLMSDGALGAWPWIGRRAHRVVDLVFAAAFALTPLVLSLDRVLAIVVIEAVAIGLLWLALRTNWTRRDARTGWGWGTGRRTRAAGPASTTGVAPEDGVAPPPRDAPAPAPSSTRAHQLGVAVNRAATDGPRRLGRLVGRAQARRRPPPGD
jgi:hypothetical protein